MAFDKDQFRGLITDVLKEADLYSKSAVELLMLTCAVESDFGTYIEQITGPALGVFQMEPRTHDDIWTHYLYYKSKDSLPRYFFQRELSRDRGGAKQLKHDMAYAILMARIHYLRIAAPLPPADDVVELAVYWKRYYNTKHGKGTVPKAIEKYKEYCV